MPLYPSGIAACAFTQTNLGGTFRDVLFVLPK